MRNEREECEGKSLTIKSIFVFSTSWQQGENEDFSRFFFSFSSCFFFRFSSAHRSFIMFRIFSSSFSIIRFIEIEFYFIFCFEIEIFLRLVIFIAIVGSTQNWKCHHKSATKKIYFSDFPVYKENEFFVCFLCSRREVNEIIFWMSVASLNVVKYDSRSFSLSARPSLSCRWNFFLRDNNNRKGRQFLFIILILACPLAILTRAQRPEKPME